jgi:hypothetical protein
MRRLVALVAVAGMAGSASASPAEASQPQEGFRLEGRAAIDDVFGDASDYRRTLDRFLELTASMQTMRDDFAKAVQTVLGELSARAPKGGCPTEAVAQPYTRAHHLGAEYLRLGRELTRHYEQVKEFDRLGESIGLTPDYRWKVKRVLVQYNALLTDYREMKVAFHDQLLDELKYARCDLGVLLSKGDPQPREKPLPSTEENWPAPGQPGAPGVVSARADLPRESLPPTLPQERVPPAQPIPVPKRPTATLPAEDAGSRSGVLFYVDNTRCQRPTTLFVDGKRFGEVPAATRVGFQTAAGPHDLCLLDGAKKDCGSPGTVRRSYLHEGWTISLRCE